MYARGIDMVSTGEGKSMISSSDNDALFDSIARHQLGQQTSNQGSLQEKKVKRGKWENGQRAEKVCVGWMNMRITFVWKTRMINP